MTISDAHLQSLFGAVLPSYASPCALEEKVGTVARETAGPLHAFSSLLASLWESR